MNNRELSVYVHFLYCKSRCPYCDFFKSILPKNFDEDVYVKRVIDDAKKMYELTEKRNVKSIFFGGGTPSLLSCDGVKKIIDEIYKLYDVRSDVEISLEANPNSFEREKFLGYRRAGINRLSLGVQALNEKDLKWLGRIHSVDDSKKAIELGMEVFDKFSIDLIYARPNQIFDKWVEEIDEALSFGVKHISLYQLSIEEGTVFGRKKIKEMEENEAVKFYEDTVLFLKNKGFDRYEVSNFARDEYNKSVHNLVYWNGGDYIGLGEGGAGRLKKGDKFYQLMNGEVEEILNKEDRALELVIMGFRVKEGINFKKFEDEVQIDLRSFIDMKKALEYADMGILVIDDDGIMLTDKGFLIMDKVILDLV